MTLRTSLILSGQDDGASAVLRGAEAGMDAAEQKAAELSAAYANADRSAASLARAQTLANSSIERAKADFAAGKISAEQYNRELIETKSALGLVQAAHNRALGDIRKLAAANDELGSKAASGTRQAQAGYVNLGRQVQDISVQLQSGTNIGTIIAQQGGQVADAIAQMGGRFSGFASFLAGPWGAAIIVGTSLLAQLASSLFTSADASDEAKKASEDLASRLGDMATFFDLSTGAINRQNEALIINARLKRLDQADEIRARQKDRYGRITSTVERSYEQQYENRGSAMDPLWVPAGRDRTIVNAISSAGGDQRKIDQNLFEIVRKGGPNAGTARDLITMRGEAIADQQELKRLTLEDESLSTGKLNPALMRSSGRKRTGRKDRSGARELEELEKLGDRAADKIGRINDQFAGQPTLVGRVNAATRELDQTIAELQKKNKNGIFDKEIAQAQATKASIREALVRPLQEARQESERRLHLQSLSAAGMEDEAEALERIWRLESQIGPLKAAQKQEILEQVRHEREVTEELQRRRALIEGFLDTTRSIKQELVSIFSSTGSVGNLATIGRQLTSQMTVEKLFGSAFRDLDDWVKGQSGLKPSIDYFSQEAARGGDAALGFASAVSAAALQVRSAAAVRAGGGAAEGLRGMAQEAFGEIVVQAPRDSVFALTPNEYFAKMGGTMAGTIVDALNQEFGTTFFSKFEGMLAGGIKGYLTAGPTGGVLGALQAIPGIPKGISDGLGKALGGAQTGSLVNGIAGALGIKLSSGGSQLGGALGSLLPIPGGSIIGSIAGGLLGNLFGKRPRGAGSVSNSGVTASANDAGITGSLNETGSNLQGAIAQIANALGASVGSYSIGIGRYKDYYQVSSNANDAKLGNSYFGRDSRSALYDGLDPAAAMRAAIAGAISQGAIEGLSDAMQKALKSSSDIDAAVKEALKVREVETLIGGIGSQLAEQFKSFERQAAERVRIARQYGFDVTKIEELNARERAKLVKDMLAEQVGSLQQLIEDMTSGSLFEGSAVDRRQALLAQIAEAKAAADAGTEGAADRLAQLLGQLNAVSREVYGTTGGFATDRSTILDSARDTIAKANQRIVDAQAGSDPALAQTNAALEENNDQNAQILAAIGMTNDQLAQLLAQQQASGSGGLANLALTSGIDWR